MAIARTGAGKLAKAAIQLKPGRYANVPMSFADGCLVALAESTPGARLFTLDRDFLIYRRHDDQSLPLLAPFAG